ncbi:MAG: 4'-phosphopantetheinyl transferase superfamily protein [Porphyromonadaceae bacterium]|nr:4'-phosphopantetheinyl transferase superfamily protein [Porphyromonadaceae bacterium]
MPLHLLQEFLPGVRLALWHLTEGSDVLRAAFPVEDAALCDRAVAGLTSEKRRQERLAARLLLHRLGRADEVVYAPSGKPEFADGSAYLSISHTRDWVAVVVAHCPIGLDVERWGKRALRVAGRFLSAEEQRLLPPDRAEEVATLLWSAKESLFKVSGRERVDFARHLRIVPFQYVRSSEVNHLSATVWHEGKEQSYRVYYLSYPDFVLTLAV